MGRATMSAMNTIVVSPSDLDVVYVASDEVHGMSGEEILEPLGLFRSDNRGSVWQARNHGLPSLSIAGLAVSSTDSEHLFAATRHGLARTVDGGQSWERVWPSQALAVVLGTSGQVVVAGQGRVSISTDGGDSWSDTMSGLDALSVWDLLIDESTDTVWAGVKDRGLMRASIQALASTP